MTALRDLVLATKGVRRVRTPAGVRYYGQPIGTIITRDIRDAAKRRKNKGKRSQRQTPHKRPQGRGKGNTSDRPSSGHSGDSGREKLQRLSAEPDTGYKRPTVTVNKVKKQQWVGSERRDYEGYQFVSSDGKKGRIHWSRRGMTGSRSAAQAEADQYLRDWDEKNPAPKPKNINTTHSKRYNAKEYPATGTPVDPSYLRWKSPEASKALREMPMGSKIKYVDLNGDEKTLEKAPGQAPWDTPFLKDEDGKFYNGAGRMPWTTLMREQSLNNVVHFPHLAKDDKPEPKKPEAKPTKLQDVAKPATDKNLKVGDRVRFRTNARGREGWAEGTVTAVTRYRRDDGKHHDALDVTVRRDGAKRGVRVSDNDVEKLDASSQPNPASKTSAVGPSQDTKDYIDEMRGFHNANGWQTWDEAMGANERDVATQADRWADKFDANAKRIGEINDIEKDIWDQYDRGDRGSDQLPSWVDNERAQLMEQNEEIEKFLPILNDLADLDRDLTEDDIPDELGDYPLLMYFNRAKIGWTDNPEIGVTWKNLAVGMLNKKNMTDIKKDGNGKPLPPQGIMDARDDFIDLGTSMQNEIRAQMDKDPDVVAARKKYDEIDTMPKSFKERDWKNLSHTQRAELLNQTERELNEWFKRNDVPTGNDPIEKAIRDGFIKDHHDKLKDADTELAKAERKVKLEYLRSIRPMGPHPEANPRILDLVDGSDGAAKVLDKNTASQAEWDAQFNDALDVYPTSWVASLPNDFFRRAWASRAFISGTSFMNDPENMDGKGGNNTLIALHPPSRDSSYLGNTAFTNHHVEVAAHEIGHAMEAFVPGVTALEWGELYDRAGRKRKSGDWDVAKLIPGTGDEYAIEDDFIRSYSGKRYDGFSLGHKAHGELFTTGIQDVFGKSSRNKQYTKEYDDNVERLILGMMATLQHFEDEEDYRK